MYPVLTDSLCLFLKYSGKIAYFMPDGLGWLSVIYCLDTFLGHTFLFWEQFTPATEKCCCLQLAEYYSKEKIQYFFPHKEKTVSVLFIAKPQRTMLSHSLCFMHPWWLLHWSLTPSWPGCPLTLLGEPRSCWLRRVPRKPISFFAWLSKSISSSVEILLLLHIIVFFF